MPPQLPSASPVPGAEVTDAILIFNPQAGGSGGVLPEQLTRALRGAGYHCVHRATSSEADLEAALADVPGTVFVAGGDGTVRAVALHLAGRASICLGIIPMGTANNIARTLGVEGPPLEVVARYAGARAAPLDLGRVTAPWGEDLFLEACGCGAFAEVLAEYDPEQGKSVLRALGAAATALRDFTPLRLALTLDGQRQPQQDCTLVEVMNTPATGPRLALAASADPHDGQLNVVRAGPGESGQLLAALAALIRGDFENLPAVQNDAVRCAEIPYLGQPFHVDGEVRPARPGAGGTVRIAVWAGALSVLRPDAPEV